MSDATVLAAYAQTALNNDQLLRSLLNFNSTGTSISTAAGGYFATVAQEAIHWFKAEFEDYDPSIEATEWHKTVARARVMEILHLNAGQDEEASTYSSTINTYRKGFQDKKYQAPSTSSPYTPTEVDAGTKPVFDDTHWDGYTGT